MPPRMLAEKTQCLTNLLKIHAAVMAFQKDHQQMPDSLSNLLPKYLTDTNVLVCPVYAVTKELGDWRWSIDPKTKTSYSYEFSARPNSIRDMFGLAVPGDTTKAWRTKQLARYGGVVPVVRCTAHGPWLSVTYDGELCQGPWRWETAVEARLWAKDPAAAEQWYRKMEPKAEVRLRNELAGHWATSKNPSERNGQAAVRFAERAVELTRREDFDVLDTLAAAYAEVGQFDKAVAAELEVISVVNNSPRTSYTDELLQEFERCLELYRGRHPRREEP